MQGFYYTYTYNLLVYNYLYVEGRRVEYKTIERLASFYIMDEIMAKDAIFNAICGRFLDHELSNADEEIIHLCKPPKFRLLVFVSSTFTDTEKERNILLEKVVPKLRKFGLLNGGIDVTFVDLRWGDNLNIEAIFELIIGHRS